MLDLRIPASKQDSDDVEAAGSAFEPAFVEKRLCSLCYLMLLARRYGCFRPPIAYAAARLHFNENDVTPPAVSCRFKPDEVDLGPLEAVVPVENDVAMPLKKRGGHILAAVS